MPSARDRDRATLGAAEAARSLRRGTLAHRARLRFRDEVTPLIEEHDALLAPVAPSTAPEGLGSTGDASLCAPWSWTGVPAIALPSGVDGRGLPQSVQLVQAAGADGHLLSVAARCERVLAFEGAPPR